MCGEPIKRQRFQRAFTFIELIIVIALVAALFSLVGFKTGTFTFWREEGFVRRFSETIQFLHTQAISDQSFYEIEFDLKNNSYTIGVLQEGNGTNPELDSLAGSVGNLSLELASILNPTLGENQSLVPPPSYPSLAKPQTLPPGMTFESIRTMRGIQEAGDGKAYITFSPRGFSEFAVIHLKQSSGAPITFLVNPFTGLVEIYREFKDFEWTYSKKADNTSNTSSDNGE